MSELRLRVERLERWAWQWVKLASDFSTNNTSAQDITGMAFTPKANTGYDIEAFLYTRTDSATAGPRPSIAWPTGLTDGIATIRQTSGANTEVITNGNIAAAVLAPVGGLPDTTNSYPAHIRATLIAGASPSGTFKLQLASEVGLATVTVKAGSWLRYRVIP